MAASRVVSQLGRAFVRLAGTVGPAAAVPTRGLFARAGASLAAQPSTAGRLAVPSMTRGFAASADKELAAIVKDEIASTKAEGAEKPLEDIMDIKGWTLEHTPGEPQMHLMREAKGEVVTVVIAADPHVMFEGSGYDDAEDAEAESEDDESGAPPTGGDDTVVEFEMTIERKGKPHALMLRCEVVENEDGELAVEIDAAELVKVGSLGDGEDEDLDAPDDGYTPKFDTLTFELQAGLRKYAESRGITPTFLERLVALQEAKEAREHAAWLKRLATFVE